MFTGLLVKFIHIRQDFQLRVSVLFIFLLLLILSLLCSSHSTSISTFNHFSSSNQFEFMANSSYRNFILRQYFIDLLNISHAALVRSMVYDQQLTTRSIQIENRRRKRYINDPSSYSPMFTLQSSHCSMIDHQVQSTFLWSQSIESLASIELIYHIDSIERKKSTLPLHVKFKHVQTLAELFTINTNLQFDSNRDFYSVNIFQSIIQGNNPHLIIESYLSGETCRTSHPYLILSSKIPHSKPNETLKFNSTLSFDLRQLTPIQTDSSSSSICQLKTIQIKFEDLGLAYLIIRPREYTFTYCDGRCSSSPSSQQQSSMHALLQSIINGKNPQVPQPTCAPTQFADDNFLLRQMDGTMEIYPIKDAIVKQCACL